jgi:hypothetical protein
MRAYMGYEHHGGPGEGACLVFAHTAREARALAAPVVREWTGCDWIDIRVHWLRAGCAHLRQSDEPHVVESPPVCESCEEWHAEPLDDNGRCEGCADEVADFEIAYT